MSDLLEIIKELEQSREKLSCLHDEMIPRHDGSMKYDGSMKHDGSTIYSPILENLNKVIQDLKNSMGQE